MFNLLKFHSNFKKASNSLSHFIEYEYDNKDRMVKKIDGEDVCAVGSGVDEVLGIYDGSGEAKHLHSNHLGSITGVTSTDGEIIGEKDYTPFGLTRRTTGESDTDLGFIGRKQYEELGLVYIRARFYEPSSGRFITKDPVRDGFNWYSYCSGNPVSFVDRSGCYKIRKVDRGYQYYFNKNKGEYARIHYTGYTIHFTSRAKEISKEVLGSLAPGDDYIPSPEYFKELAKNKEPLSPFEEGKRDELIKKKWEKRNLGCGPIYSRNELYDNLSQVYDYYGWDKTEINDNFPGMSILEFLYGLFYGPKKLKENMQYKREIINSADWILQ